jgi:endoplasmic reticulum Man9GlcNAc2 1,2-alpha-mannosidase
MSFSVPRNVPSFNNPQRGLEDGYWGSSGRSRLQNGHVRNGIGGKLDEFFDKRQLPMYKDKPYNYAASEKQGTWFRRRRVLVVVLLCILGLVSWLRLFSPAAKIDAVKNVGTSSWSWLSKSTSVEADWHGRRERVKDAFKLSWDGYEKYAWGMCSFLDFSPPAADR